MASGDNVDVIEVLETSFANPTQPSEDHLRPERALDEDNKSTGEKVTALDSSVTQHGTAGPKTPVGVPRNKSERERKIGHRRVGVGGEITYKKIQTTQIMGSIQLGIQHAVGGLASKPERDLLMQDFMTVETTNFPSEGSNHTPAHHFSEFKFKNYAPIAFRYFRDLFGIQPDDFLMSMCSAPLRELSNPGASGSIFYLTDDDEFIIKTVQHKEGEFLQTLLPGYYMNLNQNPRTLLPKFFGLYCYRCNSKNVRLVAMNNLLPSSVKLHQKYDLKGSTYKRKASKSERSKSSPTYKDLDFMEHHPEGIFLEADTYNALVKTIQRDCRVLESFKIMDYSLLVGIHNLDQAAREKAQEQRLSASADEEVGEVGGDSAGFIQTDREREREERTGATALNRSRSINRQRLVAHSTAMESIQAESEPIDEEDDVPPGGIPARNARGERLLLFLGIIDILQSYRLKKKLEHTWKSMIHDGDTVSVHRPGFYAQRFQDFMAKTVFKKIPSPLKHSPSKRKSITRPLRPLDGDFDSTAVAATGSSTMHATSPTKAVSPTDVAAISTTSTMMSSGSAPIATSTPVNFAAGTVSPPPLTMAPGPGIGHQEQPATGPPTATKATTYPAVLKGRTAASPPIPNLVPSGKVPPPVPPRGTGQSRAGRSSDEHRAQTVAATATVTATNTTSASSVTSSRGDEAAIITKYRLHDSSSILHHPLPGNSSTISTAVTTSTSTSTSTSTTATAAAPGDRDTTSAHDYSSVYTAANLTVLHDRVSTPAYLPPRYESLSIVEKAASCAFESIREERSPSEHWPGWPQDFGEEEEEEFLWVEQVNGSYNIKLSPYPFRPERGIKRSKQKSRVEEDPAIRSFLPAPALIKERVEEQPKVDHMAKFTYFINPASRADLMNYKMSRKDKKHSETYYERMKRKQKELEASVATITALAYQGESERNPSLADETDRGAFRRSSNVDEPTTAVLTRPESGKDVPGKSCNVPENREKRDSRLLKKIREKSAQRKKKLAPEPAPRMHPFPGSPLIENAKPGGNLTEAPRTKVLEETSLQYGVVRKDINVLSHTVNSRSTSLRNKSTAEDLKPTGKSFIVTKVDEAELRSRTVENTVADENPGSKENPVHVRETVWGKRNSDLLDLKYKSIVSDKIEIFRVNDMDVYLLPKRGNLQKCYSERDDTIDSNERISEPSNADFNANESLGCDEKTGSKLLKISNNPEDNGSSTVILPNRSFLHGYDAPYVTML